MMKRIFVDEGFGKVLTKLVKVEYGPDLLLVFNDQTYAVVGISSEYNSHYEFNFDDSAFDPLNCSDYEELIEARIVTKEEIKAAHEKQDAECRAKREEHERDMLARLKAKYEKGDLREP